MHHTAFILPYLTNTELKTLISIFSSFNPENGTLEKCVFNQTVKQITDGENRVINNMIKLCLREKGVLAGCQHFCLPIGGTLQTRSAAPCIFTNSSGFNAALVEKGGKRWQPLEVQ